MQVLQKEESIKKAAKLKDQELYNEIKDLDLIAKEFRYHKNCYRNFTRKKSLSEKQESEIKPQGNFDAVVNCIEDKIIKQNEAISMSELENLYSVGSYRSLKSKLKSRIKAKFSDQLIFLPLDGKKMSEVIIKKESIQSHILPNNPDLIIQKAADIIYGDIQKYTLNLPELPWPPYIEDLTSEIRKPPDSLTSFLFRLLKETHYERPTTNRLVQSHDSDIIHSVTHGKVLTPKHFLMGLGMHSITGQKKPIQILNRLGNSMEYNYTCEIETAHAESASLLAENSGILPLKPKGNKDVILTVFWADNFDMNLETLTGHGSVHSTHMVAFQEESDVSTTSKQQMKFARTKKRQVTENIKRRFDIQIDKKREPPTLAHFNMNEEDLSRIPFQHFHLAWILSRKANSNAQIVPSFSAWKMKLRNARLPPNSIKKP